MTTIELNTHEEEMLKDLLEVTISDLSMEISNTDSQDYRVGLKEKKEFFSRLVHQLH